MSTALKNFVFIYAEDKLKGRMLNCCHQAKDMWQVLFYAVGMYFLLLKGMKDVLSHAGGTW